MSQLEKRKQQKKDARGFKSRTQTQTPADWGSVAPEIIMFAIEQVTQKGGALRFGYTSDGGAYALGIYGDGEPYTEYFRPNEDVTGYLQELGEYFRDNG